jgi:hypothetical protein
VASLDFLDIGDDEARALVGESADESYQNYRNEREEATLRRTGKTKSQVELSLGVMTRNVGSSVGSSDPASIIGYFRASASGPMLEGLFLALFARMLLSLISQRGGRFSDAGTGTCH